MIRLDQVSVTYPEASAPALRDVDLDVHEAELLVVSGRTGSGKSTLLGLLNGLVPHFTGGLVAGGVLLDGRDALRLPPRERAEMVGYVAQDPLAGFVTDSVEDELAYGMEQLGLPHATMRRRVEETLDLLGLTELRRRDLRTLSGGQQQRVAIGAVLAMHPRVLVLDEPTSALDPTAAEEVLAALTRLVQDVGLGVVLAEHRLERVLPFADRVCRLDPGPLGARVTVGPPAAQVAEADGVPPLIELGRSLGWAPLPLTVRSARREVRALGPLRPPAAPASGGAPALEPTIRLERATLQRGPHPVLREIDLAITPQRVTAVMGRNGVGKSTLLWAVQGGLAPSGGQVLVVGQDPAALGARARRELVGLVPQTAADLLYLETVGAELASASAAAAPAAPDARTLLDDLAPGIPDDRHPRDLSEGQRLALALTLVLVTDPPVLLLDEPTRGLDYRAKAALARTLRAQAGTGRTVVVASHDVEFVAEAADDVVVLADGEVVSTGPAVRVLAESPAFAPQVTKVLGAGWLTVAEVEAALAERGPAPMAVGP